MLKTETFMERIKLQMVRETLDAIPQHPLPEGYHFRPYHNGDRDTWVRPWDAAELHRKMTPEVFDRLFGGDLPAMPKRCFFLVTADGADIGTATAWYTRGPRGFRWGLVHWLAILPDYQGLGYSRPLMAAVLNRLHRLRHRRAILITDTNRLPAIKTYLNFGFVPEMTFPNAAQAWSLVQQHISHPTLEALTL